MFVLPLTHSRRALGHRAFDRLFDESLAQLLDGASTSRTPAIDVSETDTAYSVKLDVPGVTKEQLTVTVEGRRVSVETAAEQAAADAAKDGPRVLYRERSAARYARTVSLPAEVDQAGAEARFENGVLTLTLPKKVPTGARRISVN